MGLDNTLCNFERVFNDLLDGNDISDDYIGVIKIQDRIEMIVKWLELEEKQMQFTIKP